ncbi:Uncharacterised protein [Enterococcus casseliflavus]|nr:hypothetical protein ECA02_18260 [Enterococcus casseliflavus]SFD45979.1 hypothetical protein SAMN04487887_101615 [Enterococcus casseliflavus]STP33476.1 Uncharacterised protein [Enterococcus casseliflavus]
MESFIGYKGYSMFIDIKSKERDELFLNGYNFLGISEESSPFLLENRYYTFSDEEKNLSVTLSEHAMNSVCCTSPLQKI